MSKVLLFNPRAVNSHNYRIPNSILQVAAAIDGIFDFIIVDGNREKDPWLKIKSHLEKGNVKYFGSTVMPGPQLKQAIPISKQIRTEFPNVKIVWGGYFAANQHKVVLESGFVDFVINGPGDHAFPFLLSALEHNTPYEFISNLIYRNQDGTIVKTNKETLLDQDTLARLPYEKLDKFYSIKDYLRPTHLGKETIAYHSSMGCPFKCSFCAVVPIYEAKWKAKSAQNVYEDIKFIKSNYGGDAIEFHDNNFFVSEKRSVAFSKLIEKEEMNWWGEGRIDTIDKYKDESLRIMKDAGLKMIFLGAESGNDEILSQMDKGGKQSGKQIKSFAERLGKFEIVPEYSFVLGLPGSDAASVMKQIEAEIKFIKEVKEINPQTEIIIYLYSPVPTEGSDLYKQIIEAGFSFPSQLEDWLDPAWEKFDLRKNPLTPWLEPEMVDRVKNFETVIHARYPTSTDLKLTKIQKRMMRFMAAWRYKSNWFKYPYELKLLQKRWLRTQQPELEGFASEL